MEEAVSDKSTHRRRLGWIIAGSFLLGSFCGSAFGVLFAVSLNSKYYPWRDASASAVRTVPASLEDRQVIDAVRKAAPSVVSIVVSKDVAKLYNSTGTFPFEEFFGFPAAPGELPQQGKRQIGGGTGFVISADGLILTNRHVVSDAEAEYEAVTSDGRFLKAAVVAVDSVLDIAVLKVEAKDLPVAPLGSSSGLEVGETVIAIGNALSEYGNSVTKGVISGVDRRVVAGGAFGDAELIEEALQTDAAINPGNSGGPLANLRGEVIGINTAVNRAGQSIGFAIPIDAAKVVIESYKEHGRIVRPWLGVRYVMLTPELAKSNGLDATEGALVIAGSGGEAAVAPDSPAAGAGLRPGDIILEVGGEPVGRGRTLAGAVARQRPGAPVPIRLRRGQDDIVLQATLAELPLP